MDSCRAVERGLRCSRSTTTGSKWCTRHEELQAKSLKTYKRISYELEACQVCEVAIADITGCEQPELLQEWATCLRQKWVLTQRTVEARIKHHRLFYAGGDESHQAFITNLSKQNGLLESKLLCIDDRAYELLLKTEKAEWLETPQTPMPLCGDTMIVPAIDPTDVSSITDTEGTSPSATSEELGSPVSITADDDDITSVTSCNSECCQPRVNEKEVVTYRTQTLAYLHYQRSFDAEEDENLAALYIDNIIRAVISRMPRLLVRARNSKCPSVLCFLTSGLLTEEDFGRLWRALKYTNVHQEGRIAVDTIKTAIGNAENDGSDNTGSFIEVLGGKVWKKAFEGDLSDRGWDHFYRFTSCSGCALSVTPTFERYIRNRSSSLYGKRFDHWAEIGDTESEKSLRAVGICLCGSHRKGRSSKIEHVKAKKKGVRSVWIERDSRNWCFLRMLPGTRFIKSLDHLDEAEMASISWLSGMPGGKASCKSIWVSRLRSAYTPAERRLARWTPDATFQRNDCTHRRLLSTSPETHFRNGKNFDDPSDDILVIDTSVQQDFEGFLQRLVKVLEIENEVATQVSKGHEPIPKDEPLALARQMFRELP